MSIEDELFKAFKHINFSPGKTDNVNLSKIIKLMVNDLQLNALKDLRYMIDKMISTAEKTKSTGTYHFSSFNQDLDPFSILGVTQDTPREEVERRYKDKAREAHPDRGGSHEKMVKVNAAWEAIKIFRGWV